MDPPRWRHEGHVTRRISFTKHSCPTGTETTDRYLHDVWGGFPYLPSVVSTTQSSCWELGQGQFRQRITRDKICSIHVIYILKCHTI